jgi:hypothetical protein
VVYRVAGLLDACIATLDRAGADYYERYQKAIEEYAGECAIAKVFGTDALALVVDEVVQIHGGYGYISDYPAERYYRDERIQRIFEGTNEVNRILIPTLLLRRSDNGILDLENKIKGAQEQIGTVGKEECAAERPFAREFALLGNLKQLFLGLLGAARPFRESQEVLVALADLAIGVFALESVVLRAAQEFPGASGQRRELLQATVTVATFAAAGRFHLGASRCSAYALEGDDLSSMQQVVGRLTTYLPQGLLRAKQLLAKAAIDARSYVF